MKRLTKTAQAQLRFLQTKANKRRKKKRKKWVILATIIMLMIIVTLKGAAGDLFKQSPHCAVKCGQHVHSTGQGAVVCQ